MLFWFVGGSALLVWGVFQSRGVDYRTVMLGSLVPFVDLLTGGPWVAHTLLVSALALGWVMLATRNRRLVRRRWLGVPIGWMLHLVLDATWSDPGQFWWPAFGTSFAEGGLPEFSRGGLGVLLEFAGLGALLILYRQGGLSDPAQRQAFLNTGRIEGPVMDR